MFRFSHIITHFYTLFKMIISIYKQILSVIVLLY